MKAAAFWKTVTKDRVDLLDRLTRLLESRGVRYCVIGGQGVNAYVDPLVSLDLDLAVAAGQDASLRAALEGFLVRSFAHRLNVSAEGSDLRVQFQTDPRYAEFVARATPREVLGRVLPVASVEDVLQGKLWAAADDTRRPSKRQKDLADIARLLEAYPHLRARVPAEIRDRLVE